MIVPAFWAEGRVQERVGGRQVTVRRFGWSDVSMEEAQANADERTREAFQRIVNGEKLMRSEPKVSYNGADGLPIREQIISRHGNAVITRNLYGALCLNTPDVLFADVDFQTQSPMRLNVIVGLLLLALSVAWGVVREDFVTFVLGAVATALLSYLIGNLLHSCYVILMGGSRRMALRRIRRFSAQHSDWHLRVYETPAGFRVLAMHQLFDPADGAVRSFFKALRTDRLYEKMCLNQRCFRARLSPKPWRIGIKQHIRPRPGHWPVKAEYLPARQRWVTAYEEKARYHSACHFLESLGRSDISHAEAVSIQTLHDEHCRAHSGLPMG